ncbi:GTPase IMAP family member 8-like [Genypterus blacodes]|uniref:GTPase IMAP family member 8-like n=1 Tax=Genypterus blacodes TaxID=154954 RepID=UPI003F7695E6
MDELMPDFSIVVVGSQRHGADSVANTILGGEHFQWGRRTPHRVSNTGEVDGKEILLVNAPVWLRGYHPMTAEERTEAQASSDTAFLLLIPVDTSFTNEQRKIVEDNMKPLGEKVWQNTIVVFTSGGWLGDYCIEEQVKSEGEALIWLVEKCGNRYFVFGDRKPQHQNDPQVTDLLNTIDEMLCMSQNLNTTSTAETGYPTGATTTEEEVDEDLKRMVGVYKAWGWRPREINEIRKRFKNSLQEMREDTSNMKTYHNREEMEEVLRNETREKSVEEVIEIVLEMFYRKECGAFDVVSIICEKDTFKPKWKQLFEREWSRREVRLMEHVEHEYATGEEPKDDGEHFTQGDT